MNYIKAILYCDKEPTKRQQERLINFLEKKYGQVSLSYVIDNTIGGFRLEVGSDVYDWTNEGRLNQLQEKLNALYSNKNIIPLLKETVDKWQPQIITEQVGHVLSVHEGPNGFRWQIVPEREDSAVLREGMITTNEPGIYLDNKFGIRTENEMLCVDAGTTEYGHFLKFETITYVPIDLDAINVDLLRRDEKDWLNNYHQKIFETLKEHFSGEMLAWLTFATRKI